MATKKTNVYITGALGNSGASFSYELLKVAEEKNLNLIFVEKKEVVEKLTSQNVNKISAKAAGLELGEIDFDIKNVVDIDTAIKMARGKKPDIILNFTTSNDLTREFESKLVELQAQNQNADIIDFTNGIKAGPKKATLPQENNWVFGDLLINFGNAVVNYPSTCEIKGEVVNLTYANSNGADNGVSISKKDFDKLKNKEKIIDLFGKIKVEKSEPTASMIWKKLGQAPVDLWFITGSTAGEMLDSAPMKLLFEVHLKETFDISTSEKLGDNGHKWGGDNFYTIYKNIIKDIEGKQKAIGSMALAVNQNKLPEIQGFVSDKIALANVAEVESPIHKKSLQLCNLLVDIKNSLGPEHMRFVQEAIKQHIGTEYNKAECNPDNKGKNPTEIISDIFSNLDISKAIDEKANSKDENINIDKLHLAIKSYNYLELLGQTPSSCITFQDIKGAIKGCVDNIISEILFHSNKEPKNQKDYALEDVIIEHLSILKNKKNLTLHELESALVYAYAKAVGTNENTKQLEEKPSSFETEANKFNPEIKEIYDICKHHFDKAAAQQKA